jgi:hypothetical protein
MRRPSALAVLLLLAATTVAAQQPSTWSPVRQLTPGSEIRAIEDAALTRRGAFQSADEDSITLLINGNQQRVPRVGVREVSVAGISRRKNVWWGLAIGVAASVAAISVQCHGEDPSCNEGSPARELAPPLQDGKRVGDLHRPERRHLERRAFGNRHQRLSPPSFVDRRPDVAVRDLCARPFADPVLQLLQAVCCTTDIVHALCTSRATGLS